MAKVRSARTRRFGPSRAVEVASDALEAGSDAINGMRWDLSWAIGEDREPITGADSEGQLRGSISAGIGAAFAGDQHTVIHRPKLKLALVYTEGKEPSRGRLPETLGTEIWLPCSDPRFEAWVERSAAPRYCKR